MNEPDMPSLLVAHHRPGFYLRVLTEGRVQSGQIIERLAVGPEQVSVAELDGLLYLPNKSALTLQRALRIPALSDGWRASFETMAAKPVVQPAAAWGLVSCRCGGLTSSRENNTMNPARMYRRSRASAAGRRPGVFHKTRSMKCESVLGLIEGRVCPRFGEVEGLKFRRFQWALQCGRPRIPAITQV